jgi:transaldolase/glucose-6-phosphate isomerase
MATESAGIRPTNPLRELQKAGQSIWLDYIRRNLITSGELKRLVEQDGLSGLTSNPAIFEKAIDGSADYDDALRSGLARETQADAGALYELLTIEDVRMAADVLEPVYRRTGGGDGYVSLEVSPNLAHDTVGTVAEAQRLWKAVDRPNLMIKVPASREGIPAVEELTAQGINVNITLMFSLSHYEAVARAYIRGLGRSAHPDRLSSVASFFVSRVDTAVDRALESIGAPEALALRGRIAIANAKLVYQRFREIFYGGDFAALRQRGARVQRPLWASTGTKNPHYPDVLYVEELIGPDTVNTVPPATLNAFRDHGRPRLSLEEGLEAAQADLARLKDFGIDLNAVAEQLQADGVAAFIASFDQLLAGIEKKRQAILVGGLDRQWLSLGSYEARLDDRLKAWQAADFACRVWRKDPALWSAQPVPELTDRLGWLNLPEVMHEQVSDLVAFAHEVKSEGIRHVVLLGMGGSSLAPEVFQRTFGNANGCPELIVLDSTHPVAVRAVERQVDLRRTLLLVSSKSGTTIEPLSFFRYFWQRLSQITRTPEDHFVAITDPGTALVRLAGERKFRRVFLATPDVGGRYSALTVFGLVPAALIGVDVHRLLDRAWTMAEACAFCVPGSENPGLALGAALGELALAGRDKVTFLAGASLAAFPSWVEQLIAESTGKGGKGIVPVASEPLGSPEAYGPDRVFVRLRLEGEQAPTGSGQDANLESLLDALRAAGHPVVGIKLATKADLGQEFFRWEFGVTAAGAVLGIHPFNQPDVELAKQLARQAMAKGVSGPDRVGTGGGDAGSTGQVPRWSVEAAQPEEVRRSIQNWLEGAKPGSYVALQAYLPPTPETTAGLQELQRVIRDRSRFATTLGYGPRFLHSTGQLHKGGPDTGLFLQLVDDPADDLPVPETDYTFGGLIRAQALGDYQALLERHRRVLRVNLGRDVVGGLAQITGAMHG